MHAQTSALVTLNPQYTEGTELLPMSRTRTLATHSWSGQFHPDPGVEVETPATAE